MLDPGCIVMSPTMRFVAFDFGEMLVSATLDRCAELSGCDVKFSAFCISLLVRKLLMSSPMSCRIAAKEYEDDDNGIRYYPLKRKWRDEETGKVDSKRMSQSKRSDNRDLALEGPVITMINQKTPLIEELPEEDEAAGSNKKKSSSSSSKILELEDKKDKEKELHSKNKVEKKYKKKDSDDDDDDDDESEPNSDDDEEEAEEDGDGASESSNDEDGEDDDSEDDYKKSSSSSGVTKGSGKEKKVAKAMR